MVSVRDIDVSLDFYSRLGFRLVLRWTSKAKDLQLAHLSLGDTLLELFAYATNQDAPPLELAVGNDLARVGVRHFGLRVDDLGEARGFLLSQGCDVTEIRKGRTMIDFFYVKDPDGNWVEIVQDVRQLSANNILELVEPSD
jgi:catechol 2,3-dioxygenase-like lactoylglutathione lyase family enzyme